MPGAGDFEVRTYYMAQTLDQVRYATPLSLATPPLRLPVVIPSCGRADGSCTLTGFKKTVNTAIDRDFVK
jgi:4-phytase/acid phosphatase